MPVSLEDLALAESMISVHGARAIVKAEELVHLNASVGNRNSASKWMRVMALIEFSELRTAV